MSLANYTHPVVVLGAPAELNCMPPTLLIALLTASTTLFCVTRLSTCSIAGGRASFQMRWCFLLWWCLLQMWRCVYVKSLTSTTGTYGVYCMRRQAYCLMFLLLPCKHPVSDPQPPIICVDKQCCTLSWTEDGFFYMQYCLLLWLLSLAVRPTSSCCMQPQPA